LKEQIDIVKVVRLLLFNWWRIVLVAIAGAIVAFCYTTYFIPPSYTARGSLYVSNNQNSTHTNVNLADLASSQQLAFTCIELLTSDTFLTKVVDESALPYAPEKLKTMISIKPMNETEVIEIKAVSHVPTHSQVIVNTMLKYASDEIIRVVGGGNIKVVDEAIRPEQQSNLDVSRNAILGFLFGAILCMVIIFIIDACDTQIKCAEDLIEVSKLPLLGMIPNIEPEEVEKKKNEKK